VQQLTAGLSLDVLTSRRQAVNLRGVETNPDAGVADGVAVYWNDLAVRTDVAFQQMFDVASIEVLRGPQGTLQGQTSPAGAIHLHTRMPYLDGFSGTVAQTFSDNNGSNTEFGVDLPIIVDQLAVRIAGVYDSGEINDTKNITTGRTDTSLSKGGRFSAVYQPGDVFSAKLAYEHLEKSADADVIVAGYQAGKPYYSPFDRVALAGINSVTTNRNNLASLNLQWDLGMNQVVWETGYYNSDQKAVLDSDMGNVSTAFTQNLIPQKAERLVQEARVTTEINEDWTSLVGLYYQKDSSIASPYVNNTLGGGIGNVHTVLDIASHGETYAIFTHQKYQIFEDGLLEFGLRYQTLHQFNSANGGTIQNSTGTFVPGTGPIVEVTPQHAHDADAEALTKSLKFSWTFNPDLMAYASYDQGFRPGGLTATTVAAVRLQPYLPYDEERSWGLETGVKSAWLDNRLQVNADVFYQYFKNGQYRSPTLPVNTDGTPGPDARNTARLVYGADSIIQGAELEVQGLLTRDWSLGANLSYVDAKYDDATIPTTGPASAYTANTVVLYKTSSGRIGSQPNWSATANTTYTLPLGPVDTYVTALLKYQSARIDDNSFAAGAIGNPGYVGGYSTVNLYLGVRDQNNTWDVSLFAKNLFDRDAQVMPPEIIDATTTYLQARPNEGRIIGVTGKYNFGKS
jgi:iron complex outermembrane receptor protein